jgi:hypothetical protein
MTGSWAAGTTFRLAARLAEGIINQDGGQRAEEGRGDQGTHQGSTAIELKTVTKSTKVIKAITKAT